MSNQEQPENSPFSSPLDKYYEAELEEVPEPAKKLLEGYSKIPPELVLPHILEVRERAWSSKPSSCVGHFRFLDIGLPNNPAYKEIVSRLKRGHQFLDIGCFAGQELRQLVADGVPSESLYGTDRDPSSFEIGYDLFKDRETLNSLFIPADIFAHESLLTQMTGKIDIIWTDSIHIFDWNTQVEVIKAAMKLLKPSPQSLIVGKLLGSSSPGDRVDKDSPKGTSYLHDVKSFKKMFHAASDALGDKWETEVVIEPLVSAVKMRGVDEPVEVDAIELRFVARKLERLDAAVSHNFVF